MKNLIYLSAAALAALSLAACSSDNDVAQDVNPTYDGKSVKTQFALSIAPTSGSTRQAAAETQEGSYSFQGIKDIVLVPLKNTSSPFSLDLTTNTAFTEGVKTLPSFTSWDNSSSNHKVYNDVEIAVGVNQFLFYGQNAYSQAKGVLQYNKGSFSNLSSATSANYSFNLENILTSADATTFTSSLSEIVEILNAVNTSFGTPTSASDDEKIQKDFQKYTTAASANSVLKVLAYIYNTTAIDAVKTKIAEYCTATGTAPNATLVWTTSAISFGTEFPKNICLPEGSASVQWDSNTSAFAVATNMAQIDLQKAADITKPSALVYYANTGIRTLTGSNSSITWPTTAANWLNEAWTGWSSTYGTKVEAGTSAIALKDNINYGVAQLTTVVKCASATLEDNHSTYDNTVGNSYIPVGNGFRVTGIMVGAQPSEVDFKFEATATGVDWEKCVFDDLIAGKVCSAAESTCTNHDVTNTNSVTTSTLVLDNTQNTTKTVNVAVELVNNTGSAFYGHNGGRIEKGQTFYLVATLDPASTAPGAVTQPGETLSDVFKKDYKTIANLTITNLKNAYSTLPDLRSSQLKLGLSVDLTWQSGLTFNVNFQ